MTTTNTTPPTLSTEQVRELLTGSSLLLHWWQPSKGVKGGAKTTLCEPVDVEETNLSASKKLIDPRFVPWKALTSLRSRIRAHWSGESFPYTVQGMRLVLRQRMPTLGKELEAMAQETVSLAKDLTGALPEIIASGRKRLGRLFDETDYPTTFAGLFTMEFREHSIEPPSYLAHSNAEEYQRQLQASLRDVDASLARFQEQVWSELAALTQRLIASCTPKADGTQPPVYASTMEAVKPLFDKVASLNFAGTRVLQTALGEVKEVLAGVGVAELRASGGLRTEVKEGVQRVVGRFEQLRQRVSKAPEPAPAAQEVVEVG